MWFAHNQDWTYLVNALERGGAIGVPDPIARSSLQRLGYMVPAKVRYSHYYGNTIPHAMALTKKGQKRALEIMDQIKHATAKRNSTYNKYKRNRLNCKRL